MLRVKKYQTASLRFTRWSRSAYAAFSSIGRRVTIGELSIDIAEQSLKKSIGKIADGLIDFAQRDKRENEELELATEQALAVVCPISKSDYYANLVTIFIFI